MLDSRNFALTGKLDYNVGRNVCLSLYLDSLKCDVMNLIRIVSFNETLKNDTIPIVGLVSIHSRTET
jgi:hypothetical protein